MEKSSWIKLFSGNNDTRYGVSFDKDKITSNDGDVCISFVTYDYLTKRKDPYCIDIGADKCWWSIFCCEHFPSLKVDAFEPNGASQEFLQHLEKSYPNLQFHPYAISDKLGTLPFIRDGPESHSRTESTLSVPCVTLAPFLKSHERIDLIKMDTEGHELKILKTMMPWFSKIGAIIFECSLHWYGTTMEESIQNLELVMDDMRKTHPFVYMLSRRDEPILFNVSDRVTLNNTLKRVYDAKVQFDCFLSQEPFAFTTGFYCETPLPPTP